MVLIVNYPLNLHRFIIICYCNVSTNLVSCNNKSISSREIEDKWIKYMLKTLIIIQRFKRYYKRLKSENKINIFT